MGCGSSTAANTEAGSAQGKAAEKYAVDQPQTKQSDATKPSATVVNPTPAVAPAPVAQATSAEPAKPSPAASVAAPASPVPQATLPASIRCHHSTRIVKHDVAGHELFPVFVGKGSTWGTLKSVAALSAATPVCDIVILSKNVGDGFLLGCSSSTLSLNTVVGSASNSFAWNPAAGKVVLDMKAVASPLVIVPQVGDRVTLKLEEGATTFISVNLNDGLVARVEIPVDPHSGKAEAVIPNVALIGGASIQWTGPVSLAQQQTVRAALVKASQSHLSRVKEEEVKSDAVKTEMVREKRKRDKQVENLAEKIAKENPTADPDGLRAKTDAVRKEEEERTLVRQVKLKLKALRAMMCPARKAVSIWRKCLLRAREKKKKNRESTGLPAPVTKAPSLARSPSVKPQGSPTMKPAASPAVANSNAGVVSSFRTVPKTKQISPTIFLDQYEGKDALGLTSYEWILRNEGGQPLLVEMDFSKCEFMELHGGKQQNSHVKSFQHKLIAVITQQSLKDGFHMAYGIGVTPLPPDESDMQAAVKTDQTEIESSQLAISKAKIRFTQDPHAEEQWQAVYDQLLSSRVSFYDESFPPLSKSIWSKGNGSELQKDLPHTWRRLFAFLAADGSTGGGVAPSFFDPRIDPNDIQQGRLGNCWFCSALSAMAETAQLVARSFGNKQKINTAGLYTVRLCITGQWRDVLLDDYFPCFPNAGPLFTKNHGSAIWVLLMEKAMAKIYGGYDRLISGQSHHALADLTGYPVRSFQLSHSDCKELVEGKADKLWKHLLEGAQQDLSMCAGTVGKEHATDAINTLLKSVGLVAGHSYTCLNCFEIPRSAKSSPGTRLIELRNPWGNGEWTGAWSDASPLWTEELKELIKPHINSDVEDGLFYMELSDFLKYFTSVSICFIRSPTQKPWFERRFASQFTPNYNAANAAEQELLNVAGAVAANMYSFVVTKVQQQQQEANVVDVWAAIYQEDNRMPNASPLIDHGIMIVRESISSDAAVAPSYEVVADTKLELLRQSNINASLAEGKYFLIPYTSGAKIKQQHLQAHPGDLSNVRPRACNIAFFSDVGEVVDSLHAVPFSAEVYLGALRALLRGPQGVKDVFGKDQQLCMFQLRHGQSHLFACEIDPKYTRSFTVTLDSASSENAVSHRAADSCARVVAPGQLLLFHHLVPANEDDATVYNVDIGFKTYNPPAAK